MSENLKKAPLVVAIIHKDAVEQLPVVVHTLELPVLQQTHGEGRVSVDENADLPDGKTEVEFDPEEEYARLEQRYGMSREAAQSNAHLAYGGLRGWLEFCDSVDESGHEVRRASKAKATSKAKTETRHGE